MFLSWIPLRYLRLLQKVGLVSSQPNAQLVGSFLLKGELERQKYKMPESGLERFRRT